MTAIGTASPMAQGQAMMSTVTAATRAWSRRGCGPNDVARAMAVASAISATHGHEDAGDPIGEALDGRAGFLRLAHQADDAGEHAESPPSAGHAHAERAGAIDGAADDLVTRVRARPGPARR